MSEQRIKILEEKICYLEDANQQLSDEVIFQKKQLDTFKKTQQDLLDRLKPTKNGRSSSKVYKQGDCKLFRFQYLSFSFHK